MAHKASLVSFLTVYSSSLHSSHDNYLWFVDYAMTLTHFKMANSTHLPKCKSNLSPLENLVYAYSSELWPTMPFFIYTSCSSTHQKGSTPVFQFTYLSMPPNHCCPSVKLLKLALRSGHNNAIYYMGVLQQKVLYEHALSYTSSSLTKGFGPLYFYPLQGDVGISLSVIWAFGI